MLLYLIKLNSNKIIIFTILYQTILDQMNYENELNDFVQNLKNSSISDKVESLLLYGKHLRIKDFNEPNFSLLFVFESIDANILEDLSKLIDDETSIEIMPFILTMEELQKSADVYPIKFLDISQNHKVLIGTDPFDKVEVHQDNLRLRCEQELRNMSLRLRFNFVKNDGNIKHVRMETRKTLYPLMNNLEVIIMLKKEKIIIDYAEIMKTISDDFKIDLSPVKKLMEWSQNNIELNNDEFMQTFHEYRNTLNELIHLIDSH